MADRWGRPKGDEDYGKDPKAPKDDAPKDDAE